MTKPNIVIRRASRDDLAELLELIDKLHDDAASLTGSPTEPPTASPPESPTAFEASAASTEVPEPARLAFESIDNDADRHLLVAEADGRIVGTVDLLIVTNLSRKIRPWASIENVIVDNAYRKMGIATQLMERTEEIARQTGCYKIQLISNAHRLAAHKFYEGLGFDSPVRGFRKYL